MPFGGVIQVQFTKPIILKRQNATKSLTRPNSHDENNQPLREYFDSLNAPAQRVADVL